MTAAVDLLCVRETQIRPARDPEEELELSGGESETRHLTR